MYVSRQAADDAGVMWRKSSYSYPEGECVEVAQPSVSYTETTLARLHANGFQPSELFFIIGADAFAEGNELVRDRSKFVSQADDDFEVGADPGLVGSLLDELEVAVGVGDGAGFFVEVGSGEDDVGEGGCFGQEHVLNNQKDVLQSRRIDTVAGDRVRADNVERSEIALPGGIEHLDEVEAESWF